jgi:hypothetical protein
MHGFDSLCCLLFDFWSCAVFFFCIWDLIGAALGPCLVVASVNVVVLALPPCTAGGCCINPNCMICLLGCLISSAVAGLN